MKNKAQIEVRIKEYGTFRLRFKPDSESIDVTQTWRANGRNEMRSLDVPITAIRKAIALIDEAKTCFGTYSGDGKINPFGMKCTSCPFLGDCRYETAARDAFRRK